MKTVKTKADRIKKRKNPFKYCKQGDCLETQNLQWTSVWNDNKKYPYCPKHFLEAERFRKTVGIKFGKQFQDNEDSKKADKVINAIDTILNKLNTELTSNITKVQFTFLSREIEKLNGYFDKYDNVFS